MGNQLSIGIDLGGTSIKMAFVDREGSILDKWEIPTDKREKGKYISEQIAVSIRNKIESAKIARQRVSGIGIGAPGFIDLVTGYVYHAVNLGWENYSFKEDLEDKTNLPVLIDNDANIAALGERWRGAGDQASDLLCITLGTGIGGGIVSNGTILHGTNGMAGEIGHLTAIVDGGAACNCGKFGCLETIASATGITRIAKEGLSKHPESALNKRYHATNDLDAKDVFECAQGDDEWAKEVIQIITHYLGLAIANLSNALNPSKIVIGGGVSKAGEQLLAPLRTVFNTYALPRVKEGADFALASLGNDAGVIGGAWLVNFSKK